MQAMQDKRRADWWVAKALFHAGDVLAAGELQRTPLIDAREFSRPPLANDDFGPFLFDPVIVSLTNKIIVTIGLDVPKTIEVDIGKWNEYAPNDGRRHAAVAYFFEPEHKNGIGVHVIKCHSSDDIWDSFDFSTGDWSDVDHEGYPIAAIGICQSAFGVLHKLNEDNRDEYLIESRISAPSLRQKKTAKLKPWLREDLPTIIPIRLDQVHKIRSAPQGGTHAIPRPHQRRGNWAHLVNPKWKEKVGTSVWRRPAWVGDQEWVFNGSTYRVIDNATRP